MPQERVCARPLLIATVTLGFIMISPSLPLKPYRIFLSVTPAETHRLEAAANELLQRSFAKDRLFVIARGELLPPKGFVLVPLTGTSHDAAFLETCARFRDCDFLFVTASTMVPEYWDLRLAWSAMGRRGVATVSPCCDGGSQTPSAKGDRNSHPSAAAMIDRISYESSTLAALEVPDFLRDCFYVCSEALSDVVQQVPDLTEQAMRKFSDAACQLNYAHILADHLCVSSIVQTEVFPEPTFKPEIPGLEKLRQIAAEHNIDRQPPSIVASMKPRNLHVMHTWGGGLERWVTEYCRADKDNQNFVLKSVGDQKSFGQQLQLYRHIDDPTPIQTWSFSPAIKGTATAHSQYDSAFSAILNHYGIDCVLVSSLIGHSLNVLNTARRTVMICHDYYPFCPALNITFKNVCTTCTHEQLAACTTSNPYNRFFHNLAPNEWEEIREVFRGRIVSARIPMVAPTPSVASSYSRLVPELTDCFQVIQHGTQPIVKSPLKIVPSPPRFRIVIPGRLQPHKGLELFKQIREPLTAFAEILLVGCGIEAETLQGPGIHVIPEYAREELPRILEEFQPDIGLLLSVVPETFSYTLQELLEMGIPPVTTRIGSFEDRITNGVDGFLCEPTASGVLACLYGLAQTRESVAAVRNHLSQTRFRTVDEMLEDYNNVLLGRQSPSAAAYFCDDLRGIAGPLEFATESQTAVKSMVEQLIAFGEVDVEQLHRTIAERDRTIAFTRQVLSEIKSSKSWKLTSPARKLAEIVRKALIRKGRAHN